jgi:hypothetical protein
MVLHCFSWSYFLFIFLFFNILVLSLSQSENLDDPPLYISSGNMDQYDDYLKGVLDIYWKWCDKKDLGGNKFDMFCNKTTSSFIPPTIFRMATAFNCSTKVKFLNLQDNDNYDAISLSDCEYSHLEKYSDKVVLICTEHKSTSLLYSKFNCTFIEETKEDLQNTLLIYDTDVEKIVDFENNKESFCYEGSDLQNSQRYLICFNHEEENRFQGYHIILEHQVFSKFDYYNLVSVRPTKFLHWNLLRRGFSK